MPSNAYAAEYRATLRAEPVKQRLRQLRFRARALFRRQELRRYASALVPPGALDVSPRLRPPAHSYRGYRGPWIEDHFFREWASGALGSLPLTYLPVFWTDYYLHCQTHLYSPTEFAAINSEIDRVLHEEIDPAQAYFTVIEYDHPIWDWHRFPRNVLVFSAGGGGDVPIPLLNGSPPFTCPPKDILVSFMGSMDGASDHRGVRRRMHDACRDIASFGSGPGWRETMARSTFTLCPRGLGRTSFRLYEALACGSIPIYVWDDAEWLPYKDVIDWNELAISVHVDDVGRIPDLVRAHTAYDIRAKQETIRARYDDLFTFAGTCRQIGRMTRAIGSRDRVLAITAGRDTA